MFSMRKSSILLALVLVFALASLALAQATPAVTVNNQPITNGTVTVAKVTAAEDGFIVIHNDVNGKPGQDIGHAAVKAGDNNDVVVTIDTAMATPTLYAMLHVDKGTPGTYEFPGADVPVQVNGQVVNVAFQVTGGLPTGTATTTAGAAAATATLAPTATTAPTTAAAATTTTGAGAAATTVAGTATPATLPTTGGTQVSWMLPLLAFVAVFLAAGLGLSLTRRAR